MRTRRRRRLIKWVFIATLMAIVAYVTGSAGAEQQAPVPQPGLQSELGPQVVDAPQDAQQQLELLIAEGLGADQLSPAAAVALGESTDALNRWMNYSQCIGSNWGINQHAVDVCVRDGVQLIKDLSVQICMSIQDECRLYRKHKAAFMLASSDGSSASSQLIADNIAIDIAAMIADIFAVCAFGRPVDYDAERGEFELKDDPVDTLARLMACGLIGYVSYWVYKAFVSINKDSSGGGTKNSTYFQLSTAPALNPAPVSQGLGVLGYINRSVQTDPELLRVHYCLSVTDSVAAC